MSEETGEGVESLRIPFEKIRFEKKVEGEGYGSVFEGEFDGKRVALKQLNIRNLANIKAQLLAEIVKIYGFRQHPNLVALLGFCDEKMNEIILVYEYVGSGNLAEKMMKRLMTIQRFEICLGAARGLNYLHTGGIVHGNIKLSKILLQLADENDYKSSKKKKKFEAKVSNFGLSKIVPGKVGGSVVDESKKKSEDVYMFGVVLLQVLCGVSELVDTDDYQERHVAQLIPKKMKQQQQNNNNNNELLKLVHFDIRREIKAEALETYAKIACQCVMEDPHARPNMAQVVEQLEKALTLQGGVVTYVQIIPATGGGGVTATHEPPPAAAEAPDSSKIAAAAAVELNNNNNNVVDGEDKADVDHIIATSPAHVVSYQSTNSHHNNHEIVPNEIIHTTEDEISDERLEKESNNITSPEIENFEEENNNSKIRIEETDHPEIKIDDIKIIEENKPSIEITSESCKGGDQQGGKVSDVQNLGGGLNITDKESMVIEETTADDVIEKESIQAQNSLNLESKIIGGKHETITTPQLPKSDSNSAMGEADQKVSESNVTNDDIALEDNGNVPEEINNVVDLKLNQESKISNVQPEDANATKEKGNGLMEEILIAYDDDGDYKKANTEFIVTMRGGDFSNSATQTQESESNNNNNNNNNNDSSSIVHEEFCNEDDTTPSDYLLPEKERKKSINYSQENCSCCICSYWQFIYDRVVLYGGLFWNKLVSCFNWITGGYCSSKKD